MTSLSRFAVLCVAILALSAPAFAAKEFVIKGDDIKAEVQKPEITILISRQNLTPKYVLDLKESFLPKIIDSVNEKPF